MRFSKFTYFYPEAPTLIHRDSELVVKLSNDPQYVAEPKYNGCRLELHVIDGECQFWDRHGKRLQYDSKCVETIREAFKALFPKGYYLFDGELRNNKVTGIRNKIVLWDCFIWDGEFLGNVPYCLRRLKLSGFCSVDNKLDICLIAQHNTNFKWWYNEYISGARGNPDEFEGLVMKDINGKLNLSRTKNNNSSWMYKIRKETGRHKF